jgi:hypothetical protein
MLMRSRIQPVYFALRIGERLLQQSGINIDARLETY